MKKIISISVILLSFSSTWASETTDMEGHYELSKIEAEKNYTLVDRAYKCRKYLEIYDRTNGMGYFAHQKDDAYRQTWFAFNGDKTQRPLSELAKDTAGEYLFIKNNSIESLGFSKNDFLSREARQLKFKADDNGMYVLSYHRYKMDKDDLYRPNSGKSIRTVQQMKCQYKKLSIDELVLKPEVLEMFSN